MEISKKNQLRRQHSALKTELASKHLPLWLPSAGIKAEYYSCLAPGVNSLGMLCSRVFAYWIHSLELLGNSVISGDKPSCWCRSLWSDLISRSHLWKLLQEASVRREACGGAEVMRVVMGGQHPSTWWDAELAPL